MAAMRRNQGRKIGLERRFVVAETDIAVYAVGAGGRIGVPESRLALRHMSYQSLQVGKPLLSQAVVELAVFGKPLAVVIDCKVVEKIK